MANEIRDIGDRLELFIDKWLVENIRGEVDYRLHHPVPQTDGIVQSESWEGGHAGYSTVIEDNGRYRFYYNLFLEAGTVDKSDGSHMDSEGRILAAYAESEDGLSWRKPSIGIHEHQGSTANNVLFSGFGPKEKGIHGFSPFKDTNPGASEENRYMAVGAQKRAFAGGSLHAMHSSDGLRWSLIQEDPILTAGSFDSQNLAFWDSIRGEYRCYFRDFDKGIETVFDPGHRIIKTSTSRDFIHWQEPTELTFADSPPEQLYTNQIQPYYRAPHIFIGFPTRYVERGWSDLIETFTEAERRRKRSFGEGGHERYGASITDCLFMTSRDGSHFNRWGEAYIRPGIQATGRWMYGDNYKCWGMIETASALPSAPAELSFFATESIDRGETPWIYRRYTTRIDGFVSLNATHRGGEVLTRGIRFNGNTLVINFATSAAGWIKTEVQELDGTPVRDFQLEDCLESVGDELERVVRWKGGSSVGLLRNRPVRLRFVMKDADLYSLRFVEYDK